MRTRRFSVGPHTSMGWEIVDALRPHDPRWLNASELEAHRYVGLRNMMDDARRLHERKEAELDRMVHLTGKVV